MNQDHPSCVVSRLRRRELLGAGGGLAAAAMLGRGAQAQAAPVNLTVWSWVPRFQRQIDLFQAAHPHVKVELINAGQGAAHYVKLRNAFKAGTGAPDVAQVEFQMIPSFRQTLVDMGQHGANAVRGDYVGWAWQQVSDGDRVFGMPWDSGPMGFLYRKDLFEKHKLEVPTSWEQFAAEAIKLRETSKDTYLTNAAFSNGGWVNANFWLAGARPFKVDGTKLKIAINSAEAKRVCQFWQDLIDAKAVDTSPIFTTEWYTAMDQGRIGGWVTAAWGPVFLSQFAKASAGQWRVAPVPKWPGAAGVSANWGGSTLAVTQQTRHPKEATALALWLTHAAEPTRLYTTDQFLFPVLNSILESPDFQSTTFELSGDQQVNKVFIESARQVDPDFAWSPFQDYINTQFGNELGAAAAGRGTLLEALDRLQDSTVRFARAQGFTVVA